MASLALPEGVNDCELSGPPKRAAMKRIIQANIDRFKLLLETETDATQRAILFRLLAEQEAELKEATETLGVAKKAY